MEVNPIRPALGNNLVNQNLGDAENFGGWGVKAKFKDMNGILLKLRKSPNAQVN